MGNRISTQMDFGDFAVSQRQTKSSFLDQVDEIIDWKPINTVLKKKYKRRASADGRPPYPALQLFKMLLIQRWYDLRDCQ